MPSTTTTTKSTAAATTKKAPGTGWELRCEDKDKVPFACGFVVRDHDWNELARYARDHAKNSHQMDFSEADVKRSAVAVTW